MNSRLAKAWDWVRTKGVGVGLEVVVNGVLPFVIYTLTDARLGDVGALIASSVPPVAWSVLEFLRHRRVDALSILILTGIAFSLLALLGGGGAKFLQLRENLVTGAIGLLFLGSLMIRRPLIFYLARATMLRNSDAEAQSFDEVKDTDRFKRTMTIMTLVWGLGLLARTAVACVLVFSVPIPTYLVLHPILGYASMGGLALWTLWYAGRQRKLGAAQRAAAEEATKAAAS